MNIGDRVRMLHSNEEGIISRFLENNIIEIEIEDGFHIPVKVTEIVRIAKEETAQFGTKKNVVAQKGKEVIVKEEAKVFGHKGVFIAFVPINDKSYAVYLINNTDYELPFVLGKENAHIQKAVRGGTLSSRDALKVEELNVLEFDNWGIFIFQFLYFSHNMDKLLSPFVKKMRFRPDSFFKSKHQAPVLNKEAYLFQLDKDESLQSLPKIEEMEEKKEDNVKIDVQKIKEQMFETKLPQEKKEIKIPNKVKEVDLHIEELSNDFEKMNSAEIFEYQINTFDHQLEDAITSGMKEITFIHGVGNGKLRHEIHKRLSGHPVVQFYEDVHKEKFGYGATKVTFK